MTREEVFNYLQDRISKGQDTGQAAAAALRYFANTPDRASKLINEVLGAEALQQWFLRVQGTLRKEMLYDDDTKTRRPAASWNRGGNLITDPGQLMVFGKTINSLTLQDLRDVIAKYQARAGAENAKAEYWTLVLQKIEPRLGKRRKIGDALTMEERLALFADVRNQVN